jgi:hypothetical protein
MKRVEKRPNMTRKMKNLSGKIILDFLAITLMSAAYLVGKLLSLFFANRDGMI